MKKKNHCFLCLQSIRPNDSNNWHQPTLPSIPPYLYSHLFPSHIIYVLKDSLNFLHQSFFENNALLVNSIKHLLIGSIFAGFIISDNIPQTTIPHITIPCHLKLTALTVIILSFIVALKISNMAQNLKFNCSSNTQVLQPPGIFPTIIHHLAPYLNLTTSPNSAYSLLD